MLELLSAAVSAIVAVPIAIFLILSRGYFSVWNIEMTVLAALPPALVVGIVVTFKYGHFHI